MSEFVLVILVTMGLGKEPSTFEIRRTLYIEKE